MLSNLSYRVFYVWRRNFTVWQRYWYTTVVGSLGQPLLYFVAIGYGLGSFIHSIDGMPYVEFLAPAILATAIMHAAAFETTYSSYTRMEVQRTFQSIAVTPVNVEEVVAGEILWAATKAMLPGLAIFGASVLLGFAKSWLCLWALPFLPLVGFLFAAIGMLMTSFARDYDYFTYFFTLFLEPMFLFSGTFFPLGTLPPFVQNIAWILPLTHPVQMFRSFFQGTVPPHLWWHIIYLVAVSALIFVWTIRRLTRRLID